ncbi:hypothetical protein FE257_006085 [Aspergillus nanangensis]|uniref:Rhodopsin domain-containing protein n=1 Tax=Aspergillus nanangensis TaxID=2582783 RepID=A0AAD4CRI7_ASPNN|nr:hypothetical protein FE257_006085 [Aspergillus nanangensis]
MGHFSPESRMPAINVTTWFLMVTAILSVFTRLATKYRIFRKWTVDDYLSIASLICCIAQSIAISMATQNGYGEKYETLSHSNVDSIMKSQYAASILFIASMCFSKLALASFVRDLTPASSDRRIAIGLEVIIGMWAVSGVIATAFQCKPPQTWNYLHGECFNLEAWWDSLGAINILTEAGIIVQACLIIGRIQTNMKKKAVLASVFLIRIFVIVAILCQLIYAHRTSHTTDPTRDTWSVTVATQLAQCFSVSTACSPQFKPFLDSLQSTGMRIDGMSRYNKSYDGYGSYTNSRIRTTANSRTRPQSEINELVPIPLKGRHQATVTLGGSQDWDAESHSSQTHIIREVRTFTVTEAPRSSVGSSA